MMLYRAIENNSMADIERIFSDRGFFNIYTFKKEGTVKREKWSP